jgi:hypothetical protein
MIEWLTILVLLLCRATMIAKDSFLSAKIISPLRGNGERKMSPRNNKAHERLARTPFERNRKYFIAPDKPLKRRPKQPEQAYRECQLTR